MKLLGGGCKQFVSQFLPVVHDATKFGRRLERRERVWQWKKRVRSVTKELGRMMGGDACAPSSTSLNHRHRLGDVATVPDRTGVWLPS